MVVVFYEDNRRRRNEEREREREKQRITTSRWVENSKHAVINKIQCTIDLMMSKVE